MRVPAIQCYVRRLLALCALIGMSAANAQTYTFNVRYQTSLKEAPGLEIGLYNPVTGQPMPATAAAMDGGWEYVIAVSHVGSSDYYEPSIYFKWTAVSAENSLKALLEKKNGGVVVYLPLRIRKGEASTTRQFDLAIPHRFGYSAQDDLERLVTYDRSQRNKILAKFLAGSLGYELLANATSKKRRWARIRWDGMAQLAKTENVTDLILPSDVVNDDYKNLISENDRKGVDGEFAWLKSRYFIVDDARFKDRIEAHDCSAAKRILESMATKNRESGDRHRLTQRAGDEQNFFVYNRAILKSCKPE